MSSADCKRNPFSGTYCDIRYHQEFREIHIDFQQIVPVHYVNLAERNNYYVDGDILSLAGENRCNNLTFYREGIETVWKISI